MAPLYQQLAGSTKTEVNPEVDICGKNVAYTVFLLCPCAVFGSGC